MRKLLSLVLAFAMILGTFAFPVSADQSTYLEVGNELKGLGVISGVNEAGDLAEMEKLTREQALVVLTSLMGQMDAAKATEAEPGFADVPATHWAAKFVAYAKAQGWTSGVSETEFGLGKEVTTKEALSFMMRALGYTADWAKEDIMKKASELGLMEGVSAKAEDQLVRGELFIVMKNTLYTKPMGEKTELVYKLGLKENPIPETLEVVDVKAENLKEVIVEFNQEVDKDTLKESFSAVGLNLQNVTPRLQEDGKTVILTTGTTMKNKQNYKITISKVKSLSGIQMEKVVKEFRTEDNEVPKVEKLVVTGPKTFRIYFSEPIEVQGKVKMLIEKKTGPGVSLTPVPGNLRAFEAKTGSNLKDGTTYTVLLKEFKDFAKYNNIDTEMELEYAKVSDAPTVEVVKAEQEYVVLKFNRPVKGLSLNNFYHTYSAWKAVAAYPSIQDMDKDAKKNQNQLDSNKAYDEVVVRFVRTVSGFVKSASTDEHPLQVGDVEVNVLGQVGTKKVLDNWGNQLVDTEIMVNITADKEAPVIESVETSGEDSIEVKFSKQVEYDKANYEILSDTGAKVSGLSFTGSVDGKKVTLKLGGATLVGKTFILNVKNVKDSTINMNKMVGTESFNVTFGDKSFDGIKEVFVKETGEVAKLYVVYKEVMESDSATDIKNYKFSSNVNGTNPFSIEADTSMFTDSIVELVMTKKVYNDKFKAKTVYLVISNGVKDLAGNTISAFSYVHPTPIAGASGAPGLEGPKPIVVSGRNTVVVKFNQPLMVDGADIDASKFEITSTGLLATKAETVAFGDLNKEVIIKLPENKKIDTDLDGFQIEYTGTDLKNELGAPLPGFTKTWVANADEISEKVSPELMTMVPKVGTNYDPVNDAQLQYDAVQNKYNIVMKFTEALNVATLSNQTVTVTGIDGTEYPVESLDGTTPKQVKIVLKEIKNDKLTNLQDGLNTAIANETDKFETTTDIFFSYLKVSVNSNNKIEDQKGNKFETEEAVKVYHKAAYSAPFNLTRQASSTVNYAQSATAEAPAIKYTGRPLVSSEQVKYDWYKLTGDELVKSGSFGTEQNAIYVPSITTVGSTDYYVVATFKDITGTETLITKKSEPITVVVAKVTTKSTDKAVAYDASSTTWTDSTADFELDVTATADFKPVFKSSVSASDFSFENLPAGVTVTVAYATNQKVLITFAGATTATVNDVAVTVLDSAFEGDFKASDLTSSKVDGYTLTHTP